jgi:hypothetical protein
LFVRWLRTLDLFSFGLGTSWGPIAGQEVVQGIASVLNTAPIRVKISLSSGDRAVPSDLLENVDGHSGVGHPCQLEI